MHKKISFVRSVMAWMSPRTSNWASSVIGTITGMPPTVRVRASYIENVGTLIKTSSPGATKVRMARSISSAEPAPSST